MEFLSNEDAMELGIHPSQRPTRYIGWVAYTCGCTVCDLGVLLCTEPLYDYFTVYEELGGIGTVLIVHHDDRLYVAESSNSPWIIYGSKVHD